MIASSRISKAVIILFVLLPLFAGIKTTHAQGNVVHAVLFFSPTCGNCKIVETEVVIPMREQYGSSLVILEIDATSQTGNDIYQSAKTTHARLVEETGVPALIVGNTVLIGSAEIPAQFPGIVADGLENDGIDWPDIPGLQDYIQAQSDVVPIPSANPIAEKFNRDPLGNSLSVFILVGMLFTSIRVGAGFYRSDMSIKNLPVWVFPSLIAIGLVAAGYLCFVEVTQTEAFCGPVGDCNDVQQSEYAKLFGTIPIAVLGLIGYIFILVAWLLKSFGPKKWLKPTSLVLVLLTAFGTLFSIYLTFLEPFVIGATCAWCLTSAVVMTMLLWISAAAYLEMKNPKLMKKQKRGSKKYRQRH
ncbi:MAG: vitamin K epoxide reductase family protein [Anaerolineaceae bacterium]|nr:vitamin K epoxide reductase family protein [Anaerolineaceae bacterium]